MILKGISIVKNRSSIMLFLLIWLISCGKDPYGPPATIKAYDANRFVEQLNHDAYAFEYFHLVKPQTNEYGGWIVVDYYKEGNFSKSYAVNVDWFEKSNYPTSLGYYEWWKDSSIAVKYNQRDGLYYGGGYKFEEKVASIKDLEKIANKIEVLNRYKISNHLTNRYGLSEERSLQIAKLAQNWKKVSKKRQMSEADSKKFFERVVGVSFVSTIEALNLKSQGDQTSFDALIEKASEYNGVDPESFKEILDKFMVY